VTRELVGDEAVRRHPRRDDVIDADPPAMKQLIDVFERLKGPVLAVERVPRDDISSYGVIAIEPNTALGDGVTRCAISWRTAEGGGAVEGSRDHRPLRADLGHLPALAKTKATARAKSAHQRPARAAEDASDLGLRVKGVRHDTGNKAPDSSKPWCISPAPAGSRREVFSLSDVA
jgi:hypothetical protein